jgi:hypothetical protein
MGDLPGIISMECFRKMFRYKIFAWIRNGFKNAKVSYIHYQVFCLYAS